MRRTLLLLPLLAAGLAVPSPPAHAAAAGAGAKPSGCSVGAKRTLYWNVKGQRTAYIDRYQDGKPTREKFYDVRRPFTVARIGLTIRACKTKLTKEWRTLDVYAAPSYERQQRDLITTVTPKGEQDYDVSIRPRKGDWGLGAYLGARTENAVNVQSAVCTREPRSLGDTTLAATHGLLGLPIPLPLSGPAGVVAEIGLFAADAALPEAGPDTFQCADAGTVVLPWGFTRSGAPKNLLAKPLYSRTSVSRSCSNNPAPAPGTSCSETTQTTWTYTRG